MVRGMRSTFRQNTKQRGPHTFSTAANVIRFGRYPNKGHLQVHAGSRLSKEGVYANDKLP
jgi:hypothetical protein